MLEYRVVKNSHVTHEAPIRRVKTAILISGRGTNMNALIEASKDADYPADIVLVISNRPDALGLITARDHGIKAISIDHKTFDSREAFEAILHAALQEHAVELVCCAGFMRVLTKGFVDKWTNKLLNIHPSLLPKYKGLHTHRRVLEAGDLYHGCTVHWVTSELDSGNIILQDTIKVRADDTEFTLSERLLSKELALYPKALKIACASYLSRQ